MLLPPSSPLPNKRSLDDDWEPPKAPHPYRAEPLLSALQSNSFAKVMLAVQEDETSVFLPLCGLGRGWHGRVPPLLEALRCDCSIDILRALLQHGADANATDAQGMNALTELVGGTYSQELYPCKTEVSPRLCLAALAMKEDDIYERVWLLLSHGADPWCKDDAGQFMAIQCAHRHGLSRVVELLQHWDGRITKRVLSRWWGQCPEGMCVSRRPDIQKPLLDLIFAYVA